MTYDRHLEVGMMKLRIIMVMVMGKERDDVDKERCTGAPRQT